MNDDEDSDSDNDGYKMWIMSAPSLRLFIVLQSLLKRS